MSQITMTKTHPGGASGVLEMGKTYTVGTDLSATLADALVRQGKAVVAGDSWAVPTPATSLTIGGPQRLIDGSLTDLRRSDSVILDEIGRGTSTFDGLALAGGIAAHLHDKTQAFTLFATHYFELTEFPATHHGALNVHVSATESGRDIVFLHEVQSGPASRSYGIQVARLAGLPENVIDRAKEVLTQLESGHQPAESVKEVPVATSVPAKARKKPRTDEDAGQMSLFQ